MLPPKKAENHNPLAVRYQYSCIIEPVPRLPMRPLRIAFRLRLLGTPTGAGFAGGGMMDGVELGLFAGRVASVCDEMGAILQRAAFSPNIKDRLDYSCAIFDDEGALCAQAAHIPVHLGSMAYAMRGIVRDLRWDEGDMLVLNDPFLGGTHLPDVTLIAPVFVGGSRIGFVVNRAHHADIGADSPGSMPLSTRLSQEGVLIAPTKLIVADRPNPEIDAALARLAGQGGASSEPVLKGDFAAQVSANRVGAERLRTLVQAMGTERFRAALTELNDYAEALSRASLNEVPDGRYAFRDLMDDDGAGTADAPVCVAIEVRGSDVHVDFAGSSAQVKGNINCPLPVTAAAVYYAFRCLMPDHTPQCDGAFRPIRITAPPGSMLNAERPAAVAAGNVETSMRIVDAVLGALAPALPGRIPAASQGSMNNVAMGARGAWHYYETIGGGAGAACGSAGASGLHTHMTNTLNTPVESLETHFPLRITRYALRRGSGGAGRWRGGDGLVREFEFLAPTVVTLISERRRHAPWGLAGAEPGLRGVNLLNDAPLAAKCRLEVVAGDRLRIETPGGGGWGDPHGRAKSPETRSEY